MIKPKQQPKQPKRKDPDELQPQTPQPPDHVEVYFDSRDEGYWYQINGRYVKLKQSNIRMHFRHMGLRDDLYFKGIKEIDWPLFKAQTDRLVDYAGDLAGHRSGLFIDSAGRQYLVMTEPKGVWDEIPNDYEEPEWFKRFVQELLSGDQWYYFCFWLAISLNSLRCSEFRPGQVVFLVGEAQCGKSFLQWIVTQILGGRSALPWEYMMGKTQFNAELCGAEHWVIEDPDTTTDSRARRSFGNKLKECCVNSEFRIRGMHKEAMPLQLAKRLSISVNDEDENVCVIPPMDASISDKVFLFKCDKVKIGDNRKENRERVERELPKIRAWLLKNFLKVPAELHDDRFLIKAWHHPELLHKLTEMAAETRLLNLIDQLIFDEQTDDAPWTGRATELEERLKSSKFGFEVVKMLKWANACGSYLGRLSKQHPDRVTKKTTHGYVSWIIRAPKRSEHEGNDNEQTEQ